MYSDVPFSFALWGNIYLFSFSWICVTGKEEKRKIDEADFNGTLCRSDLLDDLLFQILIPNWDPSINNKAKEKLRL